MRCKFCNKFGAHGYWKTKPCCKKCWKIKTKELRAEKRIIFLASRR